MNHQQVWRPRAMLSTGDSRVAGSAQTTSAAQPSAGDPAWLTRAAFPFTSRFLSVRGQRVHYVDEGEGTVLLFLHGNPTWSFLYRHIIRGLLPHYRCIALDYPGFGLSCASPDYDFTPAAHAEVVEAFVRELGLQRFVLVAHDWGGPIGLACALADPRRIAGLALFNTFAWPAHGDRHFERFSRVMGGRVGRVLIERLNLFVRMMMSPTCSHSRLSEAACRAYRGPFAARSSRRPMGVLAREILGSRAFLSRIERELPVFAATPVLILWAGRDIAFRHRHRRRLEESFPNHTTAVLPRAGHFPQEDCPEEVTLLLAQWLEHRFELPLDREAGRAPALDERAHGCASPPGRARRGGAAE